MFLPVNDQETFPGEKKEATNKTLSWWRCRFCGSRKILSGRFCVSCHYPILKNTSDSLLASKTVCSRHSGNQFAATSFKAVFRGIKFKRLIYRAFMLTLMVVISLTLYYLGCISPIKDSLTSGTKLLISLQMAKST